jgi:hypothetical protein
VKLRLVEKVLNRTARVRQHRWRMERYRSPEAHIVVGGSPRSGTTLFRRILDRHPAICCGPEMGLYIPTRFRFEPLAALSGLPAAELHEMFRDSTSQAAFIDSFAAHYRTLREKPRWAEKTPLNVRHFGWVRERFPEALLVHVIRDGRDVICSAAGHPDRRWVDGQWVWALQPRRLQDLARTWVADTSAGLRFRGEANYHELRYEDLVTRPEDTLRRLCDFLGEPFDARILEDEEGRPPVPDQSLAAAGVPTPAPSDRGPVFTHSIGRWRRDIPAEDLPEILRICGDRLAQLGYVD